MCKSLQKVTLSLFRGIAQIMLFKHSQVFWSLSIYLYILSQPRKEDIRTGAQRHRAKKKKEYKAR